MSMRAQLQIRILVFVALVLLAGSLGQGQGRKTYAIQGAKVYTLAGAPIENATVVIENGKIKAVGRSVSLPAGAQVINARRLEVYPGFFDAVSRLGLVEIGQVPATQDTTELGDFNPHLTAATAVHPASEHIPVARANGITHALSVPQGGVMSGQASAIHLAGWTIQEMAIRPSAALVLNWPSLGGGGGGFGGFGPRRPFSEVRQEYERRVNEITDWLERARHHAQAMEKGSAAGFARDLKLEALVAVVKGELPVLVMTNTDRDIKNAVEFAEKQKIKIIIAGGARAWKVKDLLKQKNVPVILRPTQSLPSEEDEPYDKPFTAPGELHAAGVKIAFATFDSSDSRTLPYEAGNAVPYGLPREEALKAITIYPAEMLGLADKLGTIGPGKIANLIVTDGDPLEFRTQVRYLFINGQLTSTENRHRQLYEKYRARP